LQEITIRRILESYNIDGVFHEYHPGTRSWLYDSAKDWLLSHHPSNGSQSDEALHRMFLLFAEPGMGKSVFSAAIHKQLIENRTKSLKGFKLVSALQWMSPPPLNLAQ
jgi:hypothetical protein